MSASPASRKLAGLLAVLVALGLGLFAFLFLDGDGGRAEVGSPAAEEPAPAAKEPVAPAPGALLEPERHEIPAAELARSTVLWPLRIELDLIEARHLPREAGMPPIGSGADARIAGRILGADDRGVRAEVRFVAGANRGRTLTTDVAGQFGASDLYPGLSIVEVDGPGAFGARREVRLRSGTEALLNLGFGRPASIVGRVQDASGAGIEGAEVRADGVLVRTGADGGFAVGSLAGGQILVEVEHPEYAAYQELVWIASGAETSGERATFTLARGASLRVGVTNDVGGPGPVRLYVLAGQPMQRVHPDAAQRAGRFPYHKLHPIEVEAGSSTTIRGLPAELVQVVAFRPGARAAVRVANLRGAREAEVAIELEAAPMLSGRVTLDGEPARGASVRLEAPDRTRAELAFFRQGSYYLETEVLPALPPAVQEVRADERGRFVFTAWSDVSPTRYLEARGADGSTWAGQLVHEDDVDIDVALERVTLGDSALELEFPGRWQGLPCEVLIEGVPLDPSMLPPDEPLRVGDLVAGRWHVALSWHAEPVHEEELVVDGQASISVPLPPPCIDGQDEEAWRRAGREYPIGS